MNILIGETLGSAFAYCFWQWVVANVVLDKSKGHQGGWMVITMGWAMAVFIAVYCVAGYSGAHLNPAVSLALAIIGKLSWTLLRCT